MNKLTVYVHTPSGVGEATISRADVLGSRFLTYEQKQLLLDKMDCSDVCVKRNTDVIKYLGDTYFKIAEAKRVETTEGLLYWNPSKNKYIEKEHKNTHAIVSDIEQYNEVSKDKFSLKFW